MKKLLSVLIAAAFALASTNGFAQEKKADAPTADMKKSDVKADKKMAKKAKKSKKMKKAKS
jgi:Ni/Co efflux regulator RcnB